MGTDHFAQFDCQIQTIKLTPEPADNPTTRPSKIPPDSPQYHPIGVIPKLPFSAKIKLALVLT